MHRQAVAVSHPGRRIWTRHSTDSQHFRRPAIGDDPVLLLEPGRTSRLVPELHSSSQSAFAAPQRVGLQIRRDPGCLTSPTSSQPIAMKLPPRHSSHCHALSPGAIFQTRWGTASAPRLSKRVRATGSKTASAIGRRLYLWKFDRRQLLNRCLMVSRVSAYTSCSVPSEERTTAQGTVYREMGRSPSPCWKSPTRVYGTSM